MPATKIGGVDDSLTSGNGRDCATEGTMTGSEPLESGVGRDWPSEGTTTGSVDDTRTSGVGSGWVPAGTKTGMGDVTTPGVGSD